METFVRAAAASRWALSNAGTAMFAVAMGESEAAQTPAPCDVELSSETWVDGATFTGFLRPDGTVYIVTTDAAGVRYTVEDTRPGVLGALLPEEDFLTQRHSLAAADDRRVMGRRQLSL